MKVLKSYLTYEDSGFYKNELTENLDRNLTEEYKGLNNDLWGITYIMKHKKKYIWSIRKFGATRGHIKIDKKNIIIEIEIYKGIGFADDESNMSCYDKNVLNNLKKYIGYKLEIVDEIKEFLK